jgi:hypothetical protein
LSYAVFVALDSGINASQEATRFAHGLHGYKLDAILVEQDLHVLARLKLERLANVPWNDDLEFRRNFDRSHGIDPANVWR